MPISYRIDTVRNLILTTASGVLTDDEILNLKRRLAADPDLKPDMCELSDVRAISELQVTSDGIRRMVAIDSLQASVRKGYKLAILADQDWVFGMARMYQTLTEENLPDVRVFRTEQSALRWLDRPGLES